MDICAAIPVCGGAFEINANATECDLIPLHKIYTNSMKVFKISIFLLLPVLMSAQHMEIGVFGGVSNYLGDLSSNSQKVYFENTGFSGAIFGRYNFNSMVAARLQLGYFGLSGGDALAADPAIVERNLSFQANLFELSLTGELNLPGYQPYNLSQPFSPFLYAGIALYHADPIADYAGVAVKLRPLGTEGQGLPGRPEAYGATGFAIPMGLGIKYAVSDKLNISLEAGARMTFSDYLDDVSGTYMSYPELLAGNGELAAALGNRSGELNGGEPVIVPTGTPRGDGAARDWYFNVGVSISYNFMDNGLVGSRGRTRKKAGCKN
jgi:hypothetical protein